MFCEAGILLLLAFDWTVFPVCRNTQLRPVGYSPYFTLSNVFYSVLGLKYHFKQHLASPAGGSFLLHCAVLKSGCQVAVSGRRNDKPMMGRKECEAEPLETPSVYVAVISLPLASRPSIANPAKVSETTTTVIASTAG
jgi:hypothetical protein